MKLSLPATYLALLSILQAAEPVPKVWMSCWGNGDLEAIYADCRAHGVERMASTWWRPCRIRPNGVVRRWRRRGRRA